MYGYNNENRHLSISAEIRESSTFMRLSSNKSKLASFNQIKNTGHFYHRMEMKLWLMLKVIGATVIIVRFLSNFHSDKIKLFSCGLIIYPGLFFGTIISHY